MEIERKYGVQTDIYFPLIVAGDTDFATSSNYTYAAGDIKISKDGGAAANVTNSPSSITMGNGAMWKLTLTATEMQAAKIVITVVDSATKAVEDQMILIATYGNASAEHAFDRDTATQTVTVNLDNIRTQVSDGLSLIHLDHLFAVEYDPDAIPGSVTAVWNRLLQNVGASFLQFTPGALGQAPQTPTSAVAAAVFTTATSAYNTAGDFGAEIQLHALSTEVAALNNVSVAQVRSEVDDALSVIHLDHLFANDYDPGTPPGSITSVWNRILQDAGASILQFTSTALAQAPAGGATAAEVAAEIYKTATSAYNTAGDFGAEIQSHALSSEVVAAAGVRNEMNDALSVIHLDHLFANEYDPDAIPGSVTAVWNRLLQNVGASFLQFTATALAQAPDSTATTEASAIAAAVFTTATSAYNTAGDFGAEIQSHALSTEVVNAAGVRNEIDDALSVIHLDHLFASDYDPGTPPGSITSVWNRLLQDAGASILQFTATALGQAPTGGATAAQIAAEVYKTATSAYNTAGDFGAEIQSHALSTEVVNAAGVRNEVDDALSVIHLDHLFASDYDPGTPPGSITSVWNRLLQDAGASILQFTSTALGQAPTGGATAAQIAAEVYKTATSAYNTAGDFGAEIQSHALSTEVVNAAGVRNEVDDALSVIHLDHLFANTYDPDAIPGSVTAVWNRLLQNVGASFLQFTATTLAQAPDSTATTEASAIAAEIYKTATSAYNTAGDFGAEIQSHALSTEVVNAAGVRNEVDDALSVIHLDHLFANDYDPGTPPGSITAVWNRLLQDAGGSILQFTSTTLAQAPTGGATAAQIAAEVYKTATSAYNTAGDFGAEIQSHALSTEVVNAAGVRNEVNDALSVIHLDHLFANTYDPGTTPGSITAFANRLVEDAGGSLLRFTRGVLGQAPQTPASAVGNMVWNSGASAYTSASTFGKLISSIRTDSEVTIPALIAALNDISAAEVNAEVVDVVRTDTIPDSVSTDGSQPTIAQAIYLMLQFLTDKVVSGTTLTVRKPDGSTGLATFTLNSATTPTDITRTT